MLVRAKATNAIPYILEAASKIKGFEHSEEDLSLYMVARINSPTLLVLMDLTEEGDLNGLLVAERSTTLLTPEIMVVMCYIDPKAKNLGDIFMSKVEAWAKLGNIKYISAMTGRGTEGFIKKYGFKLRCHYIRKTIGG